MGSQFRKGLIHGIPIALGYLSVSFGFETLFSFSSAIFFASWVVFLSNSYYNSH